jgi:hypothetical protein
VVLSDSITHFLRVDFAMARMPPFLACHFAFSPAGIFTARCFDIQHFRAV